VTVLTDRSAVGLKELERISHEMGKSADIAQGGGGNTSVKLDGELMAVKASGCRLSEVTVSDGYVVVNYRNIREYFRSADLTSGFDYEKDSPMFVQKNIVKIDWLKDLRPSVEAGFHSLLDKYVIHSHSVYANILCCSAEGPQIAEEIFEGSNIGFVWVPYVNPGFMLAMAIMSKVDEYRSKTGRSPEAIFMGNHGLVIHSGNCSDCIGLHERVNALIKDHFNITQPYPEIRVREIGPNKYAGDTPYLDECIKNGSISETVIKEVALYPDQVVYLSGNVFFSSVTATSSSGEFKLVIDPKTSERVYNTGYNEAQTMEETLAGFIFVLNAIKKHGLQMLLLSQDKSAGIKNWEANKYRKTVLFTK